MGYFSKFVLPLFILAFRYTITATLIITLIFLTLNNALWSQQPSLPWQLFWNVDKQDFQYLAGNPLPETVRT